MALGNGRAGLFAATMLAGLLAVVLGLTSRPDAPLPPDTLAVVEGVPLRLDQVMSRAGPAPAEGEVDVEWAAEQLEARIVEQAVFQYGANLGLLENDVIVRRRVLEEVRQLAMNEARTREISDDELREFFEANREVFRAADYVRVSQLFVPVGDESYREVDQLSHQLQQGVSWDSLAIIAPGSEAPFPIDGQWMRPTTLDDLYGERFSAAIEILQDGEASDPFQTGFGWHIVRLKDRRGGELRDFDDVRDNVEARIRNQTTREALYDDLQRIRTEAEVWIAPDAAQRIIEAVETARNPSREQPR